MGLAPVARQQVPGPPTLVQLLANPVRWRLLEQLVHSDRRVWELTGLIGERQSLVSYHLGQLFRGGLVRTRRSAADGRDTYYAIDLASCSEQLQAVGGALHPALHLVPAQRRVHHTERARRRRRVLFVCTGNSARSQMAEALLVQMSHGTIDAASAGSGPKPVHPNAIRVMNTRGVDISGQRSKHLDEFVGKRLDAVITLCDKVREVCPEFPSHPRQAHWSIPDPAREGATDRSTYPAFERLAHELETRIGFLLHEFDARATRRSPHAGR